MNEPKKSISLDAFLLTSQSRDISGRFEITLWASSSSGEPVRISVDNFRPLFFCSKTVEKGQTASAQERKTLDLSTFAGNQVDCLYFRTNGDLQNCARSLRTQNYAIYESDIHPLERFLMERMVTGGLRITGSVQKSGNTLFFKNPHVRGTDVSPSLKVVSLDIETCVATGEIYSIACTDGGVNAVFIRGSQSSTDEIQFCKDERELLLHFFTFLKNEDPDIIIGWNVVDFDLKVISERCQRLGLGFEPGRERGSRMVQGQNSGLWNARIPGRVIIDVPMMLRAYHHSFEEYSLDFVASEILGLHKTIQQTGREKIAQIDYLFANDKMALARYNLTDTQLTLQVFEKTGLLQNAIERSKRSGQTLERSGGSVATFDYLYLPKLHRAGFVANDVLDIRRPDQPLPGGYVLEPQPGLYHNVLVFDFKSLYPSLIMTFLIDPLGFRVNDPDRITNPTGTTFSRKHSILPGIIRELMEARARAKKDKNPYLSQAIKILMNSFYGVLGSTGCRFFSQEIASTITLTGQHILKLSIEQIEKVSGKKVIYGDTDSLFVHLGPDFSNQADAFGFSISQKVTDWLSEHLKKNYAADSALELQYENHFRHFFMPSLRGGGPNQGSKKHYCGSTINKDGSLKLLFKGMESARSDWTELAKEFQHELFIRFFSNVSLEDFVASTADKLQSGMLDEKLVYKKRLRKGLDEYTSNVPPHVQAAKLLDSPGHTIKYLITVDGPQPVEKISSPLDYDHYLFCQLKPIADTILEWTGTSFDRIISGQQDLFG